MNLETLYYIPSLFSKLFNHLWLKILGVSAYLVTYPFFDESNHIALMALFFLILFDLITAIIASFKVGMEIKSSKILKTALKMSIYYLLIASGHLAELAGVSFLPIDETIIIVLATTELVSILENVTILGYVIPKKLLNKLKEFRDEQ